MVPGVIDSDFTGEIKIMVQPPTKTVQIHSGQRIAQLLLLPYKNSGSPVTQVPRGNAGFGSSDKAFWVQEVKGSRPVKTLKVQGKLIEGLLDTGADVSCISGKDWPSKWPTSVTPSTLVGLGQASNVAKSSEILHWSDGEQQGTFCPYVVPALPFTLWGRDVLQQMGVLLMSSNELISAQMLQMGVNPEKGLGKQAQGRLEYIIAKNKNNRSGLGYQDLS